MKKSPYHYTSLKYPLPARKRRKTWQRSMWKLQTRKVHLCVSNTLWTGLPVWQCILCVFARAHDVCTIPNGKMKNYTNTCLCLGWDYSTMYLTKEINTPPKMSTAVMITPNCAVTYEITASLSQPLNFLFSYKTWSRMLYRNISFLIKHIINRIVVKV